MKKKPRKITAKSDINITPLIDILLVLLVIFMTITPQTPKALDAAIPQPPPPNAPPQKHDDQLVIVSVDKQKIMINQETVDESALSDRLRDIFRSRQDKTMFVNADPELKFEDVAKVIDVAKPLVDKIGLMTERIGVH
jgi:biopolymer transport protein ExbD